MKRLSDYLKETYGEKLYKLSLSSGCTCPTRDGTLGYGGCTFCSEKGSGDFAVSLPPGEKIVSSAKKYIAYYQSFTNTYGDTKRLQALYTETIRREDIAVLSLGTRPDCLDDDVMNMLKTLSGIKPVWVELGLQTIREDTAERIHRGYPLSVFEEGYRKLTDAGIPVVVHVIFGLPGETKEDMLHTIRYLSGLSPVLFGIKIHMLYVIRGTQLAKEYEQDPFPLLTLEEYTDLVAESLRILPDETVIHRMTGDPPGKLLVAPEWVRNKKKVLNTINRKVLDPHFSEGERHSSQVSGTEWGKTQDKPVHAAVSTGGIRMMTFAKGESFRNMYTYGKEDAEVVLLQMIGDHEEELLEEELACMNEKTGGSEFFFCACKVNDWNRDLSPWEAPPVFGKEGFDGEAENTLTYLIDEVIPHLPGGTKGKKIILGGYSLAGLFALWAAYQTDLFYGVAAASPSVWFPGFVDYAREQSLHAQAVYLSLGNKEEKAKNRTLASVGDAVRELAAHYKKSPGLASVMEWNEGNHFQDAALRTGNAFAWVVNNLY